LNSQFEIKEKSSIFKVFAMSVSKSPPSRGYLGRSILLLLGAGAITCSVFAALSCDFLGVENVNVDPVFPDDLHVDGIGIFSYNMATIEKCIFYENQFWNSSFNEFMLTAQFAALVAPVFGILAWLAVFSELLCCQYRSSFVLQNVLFLLAFISQWCTFFLFGQTNFCFFDGVMNCDWKMGSILSITAGGIYYICSILLCCMPRPNPCLEGRNERSNGNTNNTSSVPRDVEKGVSKDSERHGGTQVENTPHDV